ncbi:MAG: PsbP-related protein [Patescibacteria group bacterium]
MFTSIKHFFAAIDKALAVSEKYIDKRILTGKFVEDLVTLTVLGKKYLKKHWPDWCKKILAAPITKLLIKIALFSIGIMRKIPIFGEIVPLSADGFNLWGKFFNQLSLLFLSTLLLFFGQVLLLNNSLLLFFITLPLSLLLLLLTIITTYALLQKRDEKKPTKSLAEIKEILKQSFFSFSFLFFYHLFILLNILILFFLFAFFLQTSFNEFTSTWTSSFIFWLSILFVGSLLLFCATLFSLIAWQAYFGVIFAQQKTFSSLVLSWQLLKRHASVLCFFPLCIVFLSIPAVEWAGLQHTISGSSLGLFLLFHILLFLGWLMRRRFLDTQQPEGIKRPANMRVFHILFGIGVLNYILLTTTMVQFNPQISVYIQELRNQLLLLRVFETYTNKQFGYTIQYPTSWSVYEWDQRKQSVTLYTNETKTENGGIWVTITVLPVKETEFENLLSEKPGLISYDTGTRDLVSKITNFSLQEYQGLEYTYIKEAKPYAEYQKHYLIRRGDNVYDISLRTNSREVEAQNSMLFRKIIDSFRLTN